MTAPDAQARTQVQPETAVPAGKGRSWKTVLKWSCAAVVALGVLAVYTLSEFEHYTLSRRVGNALVAGHQAKSAVTGYYEQHKRLPADLRIAMDEAQMTLAVLPEVKSVTMEATNAIRVTLAIPSLEGKSLLFVPRVDKDEVHWKCRSDDVPQRSLPETCRER